MMEGMARLYEGYPELKGLAEKTKCQLETGGIMKKLFSGEYLKTQEDSCSGTFFVISGRVRVYRLNEQGDQTLLYHLEAGDICHESLGCSLKYDALNLTAEAIHDSEVFIVPPEVLQQYLLTDIGFLQYIYSNLYSNFRVMIDHKEEMIHQSIEDRLLNVLYGKGNKIVYVTHQELANELGTAREVISRKLKELERRGELSLQRGKIQLLSKRE